LDGTYTDGGVRGRDPGGASVVVAKTTARVLDIAAATTRPLVVATMVFRNFGSAVSTGPVLSTAMTLTEAPTLKPRRRAARAVSDSEVVPLINRCVTVRIIWRVLFALSGGGLDLVFEP